MSDDTQYDTVEPSPEEIEEARLFFGDGDGAALRELMDPEELGDFWRTIRRAQNVATAIESHPYASDSRKAKFRIGLWLWNGRIAFHRTDPLRFDPANRDRFIRAMRVCVGLPSEAED